MSTTKQFPQGLFRKNGSLEKVLSRLAKQEPQLMSALKSVAREAAKWKSLPKGWTDESVGKFWGTLTGDVKHKVTKCMKQMGGKVDDTGAFCASLADRVDPGWRKRTASSKWDPKFESEDTARVLGDRRFKYVPFHNLDPAAQTEVRRTYPHKSVGAKYDFREEHYYYPLDKAGKLARGRRVLAIPYKLIMDDQYMKSLGYTVNEEWDKVEVPRSILEVLDQWDRAQTGSLKQLQDVVTAGKPVPVKLVTDARSQLREFTESAKRETDGWGSGDVGDLRQLIQDLTGVLHKFHKEGSMHRRAAANTITIIEEFLTKLWPGVEKQIEAGNYKEAARILGMMQHAYFYALGMNEYLIWLSDTRDGVWFMTPMLKALEKGDQTGIAEGLEEGRTKAVPEWKANLHKYQWQKGMTADEIYAQAKRILGLAYKELKTVGGRKVSDVFFTRGPAAAQAYLDAVMARKQKRQPVAYGDPGAWGKSAKLLKVVWIVRDPGPESLFQDIIFAVQPAAMSEYVVGTGPARWRAEHTAIHDSENSARVDAWQRLSRFHGGKVPPELGSGKEVIRLHTSSSLAQQKVPWRLGKHPAEIRPLNRVVGHEGLARVARHVAQRYLAGE